jgi:hypothetical protein
MNKAEAFEHAVKLRNEILCRFVLNGGKEMLGQATHYNPIFTLALALTIPKKTQPVGSRKKTFSHKLINLLNPCPTRT